MNRCGMHIIFYTSTDSYRLVRVSVFVAYVSTANDGKFSSNLLLVNCKLCYKVSMNYYTVRDP